MPQQRVVSLWVQTAPFPIGGNSKQNGRLVVAVYANYFSLFTFLISCL